LASGLASEEFRIPSRNTFSCEPKYLSISRALGILDPNNFHSLWGLVWILEDQRTQLLPIPSSYVNGLYKSVVDAVENITPSTRRPSDDPLSFSIRHGYTSDSSQTEITVHEDAPEQLRKIIPEIAVKAGWDYDDLFDIGSRIGKKSWELPTPREAHTASRIQLQRFIFQWEWYQVYDFIEILFAAMADWQVLGSPEKDFEQMLNDYFRHAGVGWQLQEGKIISRGSEPFEATIRKTISSLTETRLHTAQRENPRSSDRSIPSSEARP
jgi:hypothetical protein